MKLFNTLSLEITSWCNRKCKFCPVAYNTRPKHRMKVDILDDAAVELASIRYRGRVEFYIYNEPCAEFSWLLECVSKFRKMVPNSCLMIATNGDYIQGPKEIESMFDAGLNQILINCYSKGLYARRKKDWLSTISDSIKLNRSVYQRLPPSSKSIEILDKSVVETFGTGIFRLANRAGNISEFIPSLKVPAKRMCVKPFRILNIDCNGNALVCCQDYHADMSYGNLKTETLVDLWNHNVMNTYRRNLLAKDRSMPLCKHCDCTAGAYSYNVPAPDGKVVSKLTLLEMFHKRKIKRTKNPGAVNTGIQ